MAWGFLLGPGMCSESQQACFARLLQFQCLLRCPHSIYSFGSMSSRWLSKRYSPVKPQNTADVNDANAHGGDTNNHNNKKYDSDLGHSGHSGNLEEPVYRQRVQSGGVSSSSSSSMAVSTPLGEKATPLVADAPLPSLPVGLRDPGTAEGNPAMSHGMESSVRPDK